MDSKGKSSPPQADLARCRWTLGEAIKIDDLLRSYQSYGFVKSSRCKARKT